jgi:hypothetical protein
LGAIEKATEKAMEVLHPNHWAIILAGGPILSTTRVINQQLLLVNLQLRNRDPEVFLIVKELVKYEHGHVVALVDSFVQYIIFANPTLDLREEEGGSSDDVVWKALCSVIPSRVPLDRCEGCECDNVEEEFHAFPVCAQCKTAVYCSKKCQRAHWKEGHKTTCHPNVTGGV